MDTPTPPAPPVPTPAPIPPPMPAVPMPPVPKKHGAWWLTAIIVLLLVAAYGAYAFYLGMWPFGPGAAYPTPTPSASATPDLGTLFDLTHKTQTTKIFYSDDLGIGFTYDSGPISTYAYHFTATQIGDRVYVYITNTPTYNKPQEGQSVEVFTKDPDTTLAQAIQSKFLASSDPKDCFPTTYTSPIWSTPQEGDYVFAEISVPQPIRDLEDLETKIAKCPSAQGYTVTNGAQFFAMDKNVPDKFMFFRIGQEAAFSDGTLNQNFGWPHSLRVLK